MTMININLVVTDGEWNKMRIKEILLQMESVQNQQNPLDSQLANMWEYHKRVSSQILNFLMT
jgi:hypothetical protein